MNTDYDLLVIGAGPGGHAAALEGARLGAKVAIVEKQWWGGTCANVGCIPTKALIAAGRRFSNLSELGRFGITIGDVSFDWAKMQQHRSRMVKIATMGVRKSLEQAGVDLLEGEAFLQKGGEVLVADPDGPESTIAVDKIIIAWGSEVKLLPGITLSERVMSSREMLELDSLPEQVIIVGGGVIGVEWAGLLAQLGVQVQLVEYLPQLLPFEDEDVSQIVFDKLDKLGVDLHLDHKVVGIEDEGGGITLKAENDGKEVALNADLALMAVGRKPLLYTDQLEVAGIESSRAGITVDKYLQTKQPNIFAIGDVVGGLLLAHRASAQGELAVHNALQGNSKEWDESAVPRVVYSSPEVATVGITERDAQNNGVDITTHTAQFSSVVKARIENQSEGFCKLIFAEEVIVGAMVVGDHSSELISGLALAIQQNMTREQLRSWVFPHPSLSEVVKETLLQHK